MTLLQILPVLRITFLVSLGVFLLSLPASNIPLKVCKVTASVMAFILALLILTGNY